MLNGAHSFLRHRSHRTSCAFWAWRPCWPALRASWPCQSSAACFACIILLQCGTRKTTFNVQALQCPIVIVICLNVNCISFLLSPFPLLLALCGKAFHRYIFRPWNEISPKINLVDLNTEHFRHSHCKWRRRQTHALRHYANMIPIV